MSKTLAYAALTAVALSPLASSQLLRPARNLRAESFIGYVEDEFIVVLKSEVAHALVVAQNLQGLPSIGNAGLQAIVNQIGAVRFAKQFEGSKPQPSNSPYPDLTGHFKVQLASGRDRVAAMASFALNADVDHVEPIGMHALYNEPDDPYYKGSPNPSFNYDQWHLWGTHGIDAELAWDANTGSDQVLVGILDSGVRYFHIDLGGNSAQWGPGNPFSGGNIFINPGEVPGNGSDDDGNGYVDDTIGWDFVQSTGGGGVSCIDDDCSGADNDPDDFNGHGTHVAGTVGAITNNGVLVSGVAGGFSASGDGVRLVPMRIGYHARYQGRTTGIVRMDYAAEAMNYMAGLVDQGHNVASINCSWGSSNSGGLDAAVDNLLAHDVMIVHAAGNSGNTSAGYLGNKAGVMNVAATDINGNGASFSNHGSWVDVAAPGVAILSTYRNPDDSDPAANYIALLDGTSMASPHVAGIAALLESCTPGLTGPQKFAHIVGNTDPYTDSRNLGSGIANIKKAMDAAGCSGTPCDLTSSFIASATNGCASFLVNFTDQSSGTGIVTWTWDFGDGNGSTAQSPSHSYAAAGSYTVSLTVGDGTCSDSETQAGLISVSASPIADFSGSPTSGGAPLNVNFTDLTSGSPSSWLWDFGDGNSSTAQNPSHSYLNPGTFTVSLTASNACGSDLHTKADYITASEQTGPTECSVFDIVVTKVNLGGGNKQGRAVVTIHDDNGDAVQGATVMGDFSGKTSDLNLTGVTDASGQIIFLSSVGRGGGEWCFEVTSVSHGSLTYNSGANGVTQSCEGGDVF
ncbi:MAG: serine protease [Planctomycetota bacterium]|jgi:serine protease